MKTSIFKIGVLASLFAIATLLTYCSSDEPEETDVVTGDSSTNPDSLCYADPSWFPHSQTPAPAEGVGSPFDVSSTTNQIFHQWSWQKFLWLTKEGANGNPVFLDVSQIYQVDANMIKMKMYPGTTVTLNDTKQAGSQSAILQTNPAYSGGSTPYTVYYSKHINTTMYDAAVQFEKEMVNGTIDSALNYKTFPVGSFELKVSWVDVNAIPANKRNLYYTTKASLSTDGKNYNTVEVAMLGMHVVGVVQNHPEFIWATFEHDDLGPAYDWSANKASDNDQLLFAAGSTTGLDGILYNDTTQLGRNPHKVYDLFKYGVPRDSKGNFMTGTSQSEPLNYDNIDGINKCVKSNLTDVWKNYFYNGSIWLNTDGLSATEQVQLIVKLGYGISAADTNASTRGSLNNANITMETFTQTFQKNMASINPKTLANCFSCHFGVDYSGSKSPLYLSHLFDGYIQIKGGLSESEVEDLKLKHELMNFERRRK